MSKPFVCTHCHRWGTDCRCHGSTIWERLSNLPTPYQWAIVGGGYALASLVLAFLFVMFTSPVNAQTFTADPLNGISPVKVNLSWDIPGAASCEASGSWSGTKPAKGTLTTTINSKASYGLTCVTPGTGGSSTITWKAPTTNTDSSPLTDLKGFIIVHGLTETTMDKPVDIGPALTSYTITDLPAGIHWFGIQAYNSTGTRSSRAVASKTIVVTPGVQNFSATVSVDVTKQPNPPSEVTIAFAPGEMPPTAPVTLTMLANLGGGALTDSAGKAWSADPCKNGEVSKLTGVDIRGTVDDALFLDYRYDLAGGEEIACSFAVPTPSRCAVDMITSEEYFTRESGRGAAGVRTFDMALEGVTVLTGIDIFAEVGDHTPLVKTASADVIDGQLNVQFLHRVENPTVAALRVNCLPLVNG